MSQARGTATVFGETPQRHPRRWHRPSPVGEHLLGRLGFTNSPGSIPRVLGKGCSYGVFTGLGKRGERGLNCGSDGLQLPQPWCPAQPRPSPSPTEVPGAWGCPAALLPGWGCVGVAWLPPQSLASPATEVPCQFPPHSLRRAGA